jgi:hypothetical protein
MIFSGELGPKGIECRKLSRLTAVNFINYITAIKKNASGWQIFSAQGSFSGSADPCLGRNLHSEQVFVYKFGEI